MIEYTKERPLRLFEICAGYGSQALALNRLQRDFPQFKYELTGWCDFDTEDKKPIERQPAVIAHNALHPEGIGKNWGDLTKINWEEVPDFDLLTASTPCQSISNAGLQHGFTKDSGTRSSIIWNVHDCVRIKKPRFIVMENVSAILSKKFFPLLKLWMDELENNFGYVNFMPPAFPTPWKEKSKQTKSGTLNACDYGCPQNRVRWFCVSILRTETDPSPTYSFPKPFPLEKKLKDVLEPKVDEKYYLSDKMLEHFESVNEDDSHRHKFKPTNGASNNDKGEPGLQRGRQLRVGRVNSSQDGVILDTNGISQCQSAGHGNQPKVME